jgi:hypothetical protein
MSPRYSDLFKFKCFFRRKQLVTLTVPSMNTCDRGAPIKPIVESNSVTLMSEIAVPKSIAYVEYFDALHAISVETEKIESGVRGKRPTAHTFISTIVVRTV